MQAGECTACGKQVIVQCEYELYRCEDCGCSDFKPIEGVNDKRTMWWQDNE